MVDSKDSGSVIKSELANLKRAFDGINVEDADEKTLKELKVSMDTLNEQITTLVSIFEKAEEILEDEQPDPRVDQVLNQNKQLANGMIALSNMMKEKFESIDNSLMNLQTAQPVYEEETPFSPQSMDVPMQDFDSEMSSEPEIPEPGPMDMPGADVPPPPTPPKKGFFRK